MRATAGTFTICSASTLMLVAAGLAQGDNTQELRKTVIRNSTVSATARIDMPPYFGSLQVFKGTGPGFNVGAFIRLDLCSFHPDEQHRYCLFLDGSAPAGAISSNGTEQVTFDASSITVEGGGVIDCRTGICVGGPLPQPVSFRGTWRKYTGDFSFEGENLGVFKNTARFPDMVVTSLVGGLSRSSSADFDGAFGSILLQTPGRQSQANIVQSTNLNIEITRAKR